MLKRVCKLGRVVAGTPVVVVLGVVFVFDLWREYRKDPAHLDEMIDSFLKS